MNNSEIDLNLLPVFNALFSERSVTKAAHRLGLSQPAFSNALKRLRDQLGDPLFVRTGRVMVPTPRALDLASAVLPALGQLQAALWPSSATATREVAGTVTLGMDDYLQAVLLPELTNRLERRAPGIRLDIRWSGARHRAIPLLRDGKIDLAVDANESGDRRDFAQESLFEDPYVCLARRGLSGDARRLSSELFGVLNHVVFASADAEQQPTERAAAAGPSRHVSTRLPGFLAAPWIIARSDAVALVPARLAGWFRDVLPLDVLEPPVELPPAQVVVRWHRRAEPDRAVMHVRDELVEIGRQLGPEP